MITKNKLKIRNFLPLLVVASAVMFLASCSSGNKFASSFNKRHYTKGHFSDPVAKVKTDYNTSTAATMTHKVAKPAEIKDAPATHTNKAGINNNTQTPPVTVAANSNHKSGKNSSITVHSSKSKGLSVTKGSSNNSQNSTQKENTISKSESEGGDTHYNNPSSGGNVNILAIVGFICGTLGLILCWFGAGILFLIAGLICSIIALKREGNHTLALLGLIFSIIGLLLWIIVFLILIVILSTL